ncbi:hypothetical protein [Acidisoma sp. S159]|uniref:hypothetical protein n=1 Tax=Acidisoma sp. S159 TaxID=1747225 RepID=UPI00131CBDE8|nr:hypothetical protein [Acidisoma sp. S159]
MTANPRKAVRAAELILWAWTAWVTGLGIYQSGTSVQSTEKLITDHLPMTMPFNPEALQMVVIAGYIVTAGFLAWMVLKIGEGRGWARTSLALNFAFDAFSTAMPPYHGISGLLMAVADLGPQAVAAYLLYTPPGRLSFQ